ncbi:hypothetical protein [Levilactobacillus suantsaii]|uniref:Uncharacterized protein n=1 Tax=Levilactobacillus suantsaii TaxID=2292255 RepID=A0A4V1LF81_9LACO|nr:hypothetical protein [Levilactobacillus suantsaii]QMU08441.1 hypothetical protein H3M12_01825 [Levilactobacillus suantsaii]RXI77547.1 hypothetical protein DXH47_08940 [Levilactobacillus suantsaii]
MHKFLKAGMLLGLSLSGVYAAVASATGRRRPHVAPASSAPSVNRLRIHYGQDGSATMVAYYPARRHQLGTPVYRLQGAQHNTDGWIWRGKLPRSKAPVAS